MNNDTTAPFELIETEPGHFSLLLKEFSPADEIFQDAGYEGGGYDWEAISKQLVRAQAPDLDGLFETDPEGSMFCAFGTDATALQQLGELLSGAFHDPDLLRDAIERAEPEWWD